ncbi:MAG: ferredoxin family protein [bacterium]
MNAENRLAEPKKLTLEDKLYLLKFKPYKESHLNPDPEICRKCTSNRSCLRICPADVYTAVEGQAHPHVAFENCLECGTCRIACVDGSINWQYPQGEYGVTYRYG